MSVLSRGQLLKKEALKIEKVDLDGKNCVFVREWTAQEKDGYLLSIMPQGGEGPKDMLNLRARMVVLSVCDKDGSNILKKEDAEELSASMSAIKLEKIARVVTRLNKLRLEDQEEIEKNCEAAPSGNSTSDSVEN